MSLVNERVQVGTVRYEQISRTVRWEIGKLPKDKTPMLEGSVALPNDFVPDESPVIRAEFQVKDIALLDCDPIQCGSPSAPCLVGLQVKMLALSGLKVDGLAIRGVKYKPFKGVRSVTQAGKFQVRCAAF